MVRNYKRKSDRASWSDESMKSAIEAVKNGTLSRRTAAASFGVPRSTLRRHLDGKMKKEPGSSSLGPPPILTTEQEDELVVLILEFERRGFPLTVVDIRQLAREYITVNGIPNNFSPTSKMAGRDWWTGFRKRHLESADSALSSLEEFEKRQGSDHLAPRGGVRWPGVNLFGPAFLANAMIKLCFMFSHIEVLLISGTFLMPTWGGPYYPHGGVIWP